MSSGYIHVVLMSGRSAQIAVAAESPLLDAKSSSQDALHTGQGVLNMRQTVGEAGLKHGDTVNLQLMQTMVASDDAIMGDRSVITWGNLGFGGDSSIVRAQLRNAHHIQNTTYAIVVVTAAVSTCSSRTV